MFWGGAFGSWVELKLLQRRLQDSVLVNAYKKEWAGSDIKRGKPTCTVLVSCNTALYPASDPSVIKWLSLDFELERKITANFLYCRGTCLMCFNLVTKFTKIKLLILQSFVSQTPSGSHCTAMPRPAYLPSRVCEYQRGLYPSFIRNSILYAMNLWSKVLDLMEEQNNLTYYILYIKCMWLSGIM